MKQKVLLLLCLVLVIVGKASAADFVFTGYDANPGYTLRPIRQYGKDIVYADDVTKKVTLHGVMDTPNAYFNKSRWQISDWNNRYNNDTDVNNCLAYFEKLLSAFVDHKSGSYVDLFRLHLDPAWTNTPGASTTGEHDISAFSADRLRTYMTKLYWPIAKKAIDKGMYVIMRPPGVCPEYIKVGDAYYNYLMTVWDIVSQDENVKKYAGMIMLELANEPRTVQDRDGTDSNNRASVLHDFFQPIVDKIRSNGFKGIILSSGSGYQWHYEGYKTYPITGDNIGYAVHWYPGWHGTKSDKTAIADQTIINIFRNNVPVVESRPIVITEVDWSPADESAGIDHYNEFNQPVYKNYGTWASGYTSYFGKNFKATHDYFGNISMTLTHPYEYVDFDQLFNNNKVTYSFSSMKEPKEACAYTCFADWYPKLYEDHSISGANSGGSTALTSDMFHKWTGVTANATIDAEKVYPYYVLNEAVGCPYGNGNVESLYYADLSSYGTLAVTTSAGEPRFIFNRAANDGDIAYEFPRDKDTKPYETVKDNGDGTTTYTIDLHAIVAEAGYAHLNCIKGANYADVTVKSMTLYPYDPIKTITLAETQTATKPVVLAKDNQVMNAPWGEYNDAAYLQGKSEFTAKSYQIKVEPVTISGATNTYTIKLKEDGEYTRYLQASKWGHAFFNATYDNDGTNCAVWTITPMADGKYSIRSLGVAQGVIRSTTEGYLCVDTNGQLKINSTTAAGWQFAIYQDGEEETPSDNPSTSTADPIDLAFTEEGSKSFDIRYFKVSGEGVTIDYNTGLVRSTEAGGKIYVEFNNADLSAAQSIKLNVNTTDPNVDICNTGQIYNAGESINAWYGSKYNMQNLDKQASINNVAQDYNWNEKMGSVTRIEWNIDKAGLMTINDLVITSGVPGATGNEPEVVEENYTASTYGRRPIDNKHPMWLVHVDVWNQADPQKIIDLIPDDIKPYVVMNLSLSCSYDKENDIYQRPQSAIKTYKSWGSVCQQNGMWFTCQPASGGHTHIMDDDLETFEYFFKQYPNFLGWNYAEQFWGFNEAGDKSSTTEETRIDLFAKLIPMHHKYGGFLTISFCGNENSHALNPLGMMKRNANLLKASEQYPDAILWLYKYTHPVAFYNNESVSFGPFVAGLSNNYGVRYDNCGYNDAVSYLCGENCGIKYPTAAGIGTVMEQMAQNGGAVWDGPELIWTEDFQNLANSNVNGYTQRNWGTFPGFRNIWIDMFRKVIDGTIYIPTQKEVQQKTKIAIVNDVTSGTIEDKYGTWGDLYDNIYKVNDPLNTSRGNGNGQIQNNLSYQKSSGRYGTIPMMPELYTADAKTIPTQVKKSQHTTVWPDLAAKKAAFDAAYPEVSTGDLFVSRYKNQLVTYNPYSNLGKSATNDRSASANIPFKYNTCQSMDLKWANYSSAIVKEHRDHVDFYLNNYRTDTTTTVVDRIVINGASSKPSYTMTKRMEAVATATETWSGNTYTLEINHMGPVDLTINCEGTAKGRSTNIVSDKALSTYNMPKQPEEFVGTIIKEAEDMNYKSIAGCIDNYYYQDKSIRGHSGNGIMKMGTNTAGGLTTNIKTNSTESYNVTVRYSNTDKAGNINLTVGGTTKPLALEKTATNEWKKATVAFSFVKGDNTFKLDNNNGIGLWVDNLEFTPATQSAEEYDIVLGTPANGTVTSDKAKAAEGTKVTLTVTPAAGYALDGWKQGFTKVSPVKNSNGTYSFLMPDNIVTITPIFKDITIVYELDIPSTVNSGIPEGWRATEGTDVREYGNVYNSGPRIFTTFTGDYTHALYWRSLTSGNASADYGKMDAYPFELKAGTYRLSYRMAAWKGTPQYKAQILNAGGSVVKTSDNITAAPNVDGSNTADLSATAEKTLDFTVTERGNYVINFAATGGEFLLLSCRVNYLTIDPGQEDPEPEPDLKSMFKTWNNATADAMVTGTPSDCEYNIGESVGCVYGYSNVSHLNYADLSAHKYLAVTATDGQPRFFINQKIADGTAPDNMIQIPSNTAQTAAYQKTVENADGSVTYYINLQKIVQDQGYAHLNSIKALTYDSQVTVTDMKLLEEGPADVPEDEYFEIVDGAEYTNMEMKQYDKVTYTRTFTTTNANKWNALCVPFAIDVEAYKTEFDIAEIFAFCPFKDTNRDGDITAEDDDMLILAIKKIGSTVPNKPYLIRPKTAKTYSIEAVDGILYPANAGSVQCATTKTKYVITGLYHSLVANSENNYYYMGSGGGISHKTPGSGSTTIKANRWYMTVTSQDAYGETAAPAKASYGIVVIGEDLDEATAVRLAKGNSPKNGNEAVYTLQGVKVTGASLAPGAYIKNGRKFIIK